jgi:hypothetical protein
VSRQDDDQGEREHLRESAHKQRADRRKKSKKQAIRIIRTYTGSTQTGVVTPPKVVTPVTPSKAPTPVTPTPPTAPIVVAPVTKKNTVSYRTPDGSATMTFSVTVNAGTITAASAITQASGTSGYYQDIFARGISAAVIGKKTTGLNIAAVGGASLTTTAFEQFVASNF